MLGFHYCADCYENKNDTASQKNIVAIVAENEK
jgi:hypothetical protein